MHYRNFADFRQNHLFSAGDKAVLQNDRFDNPDLGCETIRAKQFRLKLLAGVLSGNTIRGKRTRNSERKMALRERLWEGLWKTSENL